MSSELILPARPHKTRVPLSLQFEFERGTRGRFRIEWNLLDWNERESIDEFFSFL